MEDKINVLKFEMFDPVDAGEEWACDIDYDLNAVEIYIDGRPLLDILSEYEIPFLVSQGYRLRKGKILHGHMTPKSLYWDLCRVFTPGTYSHDYGAFLFCCESCGEPGCDGITVKVTRDEKHIYWSDFERSLNYLHIDLRFTFDAKQYFEALRELEEMAPFERRVDCLSIWKPIKPGRKYNYQRGNRRSGR